MQQQQTPTEQPSSILLQQENKQKKLGIDKAEFEMIDLIKAFHNIELQKHDIENIKTDQRVQAADYAIKTTQKKINLCMTIIESILKDRMKFIQVMQLNEVNMLQLIQDLKICCDVESYKIFDMNQLEKKLQKFKSIIYSSYPQFNALNSSILSLEQYYSHKQSWKETLCQQAQGNNYLINLMDLNLIDAANALYHKYKKFLYNLQLIYGQETENYILNDEQIQKLLSFLIVINEEFTSNSTIHLALIIHKWMEDVIKVESGFQNNVNQFYNFIGKFEGSIMHYLYCLQNIEYRFQEIHYKNLKAQKILKRVVFPQKYENDNLNISIQIQELINENTQNITKTQNDLNLEHVIIDSQISQQIPIIVVFNVDEPDMIYKPIGQFKGALKLEPIQIQIMQQMLQDRRSELKSNLNECHLELDAVNQLFNFFKEMLTAEKKLVKAQSAYTNIKVAMENLRLYNEQIDLQEVHNLTVKLQKYINYLAEQQNKSKEVSDQMPKINDFTGLIQRFIIKAQFIISDVLSIIS